MQFSKYILPYSILLIFCIPSAAAADQALLNDGSLLVGEIDQMRDGTLTINTSFGGALSIPWDQIAGINTAEVTQVHLANGDQVVGVLNSADGQQFVLGAETGEIPIALADVVAIGAVGTEVAEAEAPEVPLEPADEAAAPPLWTGRAEVGLNGQSGNKERFDARVGVDLNRKTEDKRVNLYLKGQYAETNGEKSANEVMAGTRVEVDFSERTYVFGKVDLEHDEFEELDLRTTLTVGLGHFFVQREKIELKGWLGGGYEHESFTREVVPLPKPTTAEQLIRNYLIRAWVDREETFTESEAVVELGYSYRHDFKQNFRFAHGTTYYPAIGDPFGDYRLAADTNFEFPLGKEPDWTLRTGIRHEYDAMPAENVDNLDTTYYLNLGYNW